MGRPILFNRMETLKNLLSFYQDRGMGGEVVLVSEAIANAADAFREDSTRNPLIKITFDIRGNDHYVSFHNNASPMKKSQFAEKYHTISSSTKQKGEGIGFAGVGAKVFLASDDGGEIITITGDKENPMYSRMYRTAGDLEFETSLEDDLVNIKNFATDHEYGTTYRVKLTKKIYSHLRLSIDSIIKFWWNESLLSNRMKIMVEKTEIAPYKPGIMQSRTASWRGTKMKCYMFISDKDLEPDLQHIVYNVFGKRINNEKIRSEIRLKQKYEKKIFCAVDVSPLAKHLIANKENFEKNGTVAACKSAVQKVFVKFLQDNDMLEKVDMRQGETAMNNELTKRFDDLLKQEKFKELNPFLTAMRPVPGNGNEGVPSGDPEPSGNPKPSTDGDGDRNHRDQRRNGENRGHGRERRLPGLNIVLVDSPNDPESWVDIAKGAVVINVGHPFYKRISGNTHLVNFNYARLMIDALIKYKSEHVDWDPKRTVEMSGELLRSVWL